MKRITLRNVADCLGLNESTVSRGLRGDPRIPLPTRQRIQAKCDELGYRPNPVLSELASARWRSDKVAGGSVIGYIDCTLPKAAFCDLPVDVRVQADILGYQLEVFHRREFVSSTQLQRVLRSRGITEILLGPPLDESLTVQLDWSKFICVQLLPGFFALPLHGVVRDHFNSITLAWRKAVSYGYRRIGITLMNHPFHLMDDVMRSSAVHACQKKLFPDLPVIPPFHFHGDSRKKECFEWVRKNKPDVVIEFAYVYEGLHAEFGPELGYACLHVEETQEFSGVLDHARACGREGVNLLHYCRQTYQWGIPAVRIDHVIEPAWHEGNTMPRKNPALS